MIKPSFSQHVPALVVLAVMAASGGLAWWATAAPARAAAAPETPAIERVDGRVLVGDASPLRQTLRVQAAVEQPLAVPFVLPATVQADPARWLKAVSPASGRIVSLDKRLGDPVHRGDVLFRIDAPDLAQARADARKAETALALANDAFARQRALGADEIAARRDIEQARSEVEQARSESARAATRLAQLGPAQGDLLAVRSPIDGRVVEVTAAVGAYWNDATQPLMTVADLSTVFVTADADEDRIGEVFVGQPAGVAIDAYPDEAFAGRVRDVGALLDPDTRRVKVRLQFTNRDGRLKPGMFANVTLLARPHPGILVPVAAVVQSGLEARVFVEVQPWRFEPRGVRLGPQVGDDIEITAGLRPGERIVVGDAVLLGD